MKADDLESLKADLAERADRSLYAGLFKGLPEDKHYEELEVARIVLEHLGQSATSLVSEPDGPDTAPDVAITLETGVLIGVEVTELVDGDLRHQHVKRRDTERAQGLSQKEVFDAVIQSGVDPVPEEIPAAAYRVWDGVTVAEQIDALVRGKDKNKSLQDHAPNYHEIWLAIFTDEMTITQELILYAKQKLTYRPTTIKRVFIVRHHPDCPVVTIS
jgi:hypothetical protein